MQLFVSSLARNYDRFANLVVTTAKKCVPRGYRKEYIPCWNENTDRLYAEFQDNEDPETAKELLKSLDEARKQRWINTVENIDLSRSSRKGWSLIGKLGGGSKLNTPNDSELSRSFSADEVNVARMYMKNGKASGFDAIYPEFLTFSAERTRLWLARFFSNVLQTNTMPSSFKKTKIIALLKLGKPNNVPESYRPKSLLSVTFKLFERLLYNRIVSEIERILPAEQAGLRKKRSCEEQVLALTNHIEAGFQRKLKTGVVFIDLTAAYDTVWKKGLLYKLIKAMPCLRIVDMVANMLSDRQFKVLLNDYSTRFNQLNNGLPSRFGVVVFVLQFIHSRPSTLHCSEVFIRR